MTVATMRTDGRLRVVGNMFQVGGGHRTTHIVELGIVVKADKTILLYHLQGSGNALFTGVLGSQHTFHTTHVSLQIAVCLQFHLLDKLRRSLIVDALDAYLAISHLVVLVSHLGRLIVLELKRERIMTQIA